MSRRYEFPKPVKIAAWERCGGLCEICGNPIRDGNGPQYHHQYKPATMAGSNVLENCQVVCSKPCHANVTATETRPQQDKTRRVFEKRIGARKTDRGFRKPPPGYDPWRRQMREE